MNIYKYKLHILVILIFTYQNSFSEITVEYLDGAKFYEDVGFVYGALRNVKYLEKVCANMHPEYSDQNSIAFNKWMLKYKKLYDDIEQVYTHILHQTATSKNLSFEEMEKISSEQIEIGLKSFADNLIELSGDNLKKWCKIYPSYTQTDIANIEKYFPQRVKNIYRVKTDFLDVK